MLNQIKIGENLSGLKISSDTTKADNEKITSLKFLNNRKQTRKKKEKKRKHTSGGFMPNP